MGKFALTKNQALVQELKGVNDQIAALNEQRDKLIARLTKTGKDRIDGLTHYAKVTTSDTSTLVPARVRKLLTPSQYAKCLKHGERTSVRLYSL